MKYETYEDLIAAYKSGDLTFPLMMDNDDCGVYDPDTNEKLFSGNGMMDALEIAEAAGIPCEMV